MAVGYVAPVCCPSCCRPVIHPLVNPIPDPVLSSGWVVRLGCPAGLSGWVVRLVNLLGIVLDSDTVVIVASFVALSEGCPMEQSGHPARYRSMVTARFQAAFVLASAVVLAACGGAADTDSPAAAPDDGQSQASDPGTEVEVNQLDEVAPAVESGAALPEVVRVDVPSALEDRNDPSFPPPLIDPSDILRGGPPPDGIPPIDEPAFVDVATADAYLADREPLVEVEINGDARAYPVQILIWHEIVNDVVGGEPVAVTYCPLCNSAVTFKRTVQDRLNSFGTSGSLFNSALVMYDRATETLWTHFDGKAVVGYLTGEELEPVASSLVSWGEFKAAHPDGKVLDRERTGHRRTYGVNPYRGYDDPDTGTFFPVAGDDQARAKQRVVGVTIGDLNKAWSLDIVGGAQRTVTEDSLGDTDLVIFFNPGQASGVDTAEISEGKEVGTVKVFSPDLGDRRLTFSATADGFVDGETGSTWNIFGQAVDGEMAGAELVEIPHLDTFWFAWSSYRPGTEAVL